jgi:hypothetical protein
VGWFWVGSIWFALSWEVCAGLGWVGLRCCKGGKGEQGGTDRFDIVCICVLVVAPARARVQERGWLRSRARERERVSWYLCSGRESASASDSGGDGEG